MITELSPSPESHAETELTYGGSPSFLTEEEMDIDDPEYRDSRVTEKARLGINPDGPPSDLEPTITSSIANQFHFENGYWVTDLTTVEGEVIVGVKLLEHDPELLERVLNLGPDESIATSSEGTNMDGESVVFTTGYVREAEGIAVTHTESLALLEENDDELELVQEEAMTKEAADPDLTTVTEGTDGDDDSSYAPRPELAAEAARPVSASLANEAERAFITLQPGVPVSFKPEALTPTAPEYKEVTGEAQPQAPSLQVNAGPTPAAPDSPHGNPTGGGHIEPQREPTATLVAPAESVKPRLWSTEPVQAENSYDDEAAETNADTAASTTAQSGIPRKPLASMIAEMTAPDAKLQPAAYETSPKSDQVSEPSQTAEIVIDTESEETSSLSVGSSEVKESAAAPATSAAPAEATSLSVSEQVSVIDRSVTPSENTSAQKIDTVRSINLTEAIIPPMQTESSAVSHDALTEPEPSAPATVAAPLPANIVAVNPPVQHNSAEVSTAQQPDRITEAPIVKPTEAAAPESITAPDSTKSQAGLTPEAPRAEDDASVTQTATQNASLAAKPAAATVALSPSISEQVSIVQQPDVSKLEPSQLAENTAAVQSEKTSAKKIDTIRSLPEAVSPTAHTEYSAGIKVELNEPETIEPATFDVPLAANANDANLKVHQSAEATNIQPAKPSEAATDAKTTEISIPDFKAWVAPALQTAPLEAKPAVAVAAVEEVQVPVQAEVSTISYDAVIEPEPTAPATVDSPLPANTGQTNPVAHMPAETTAIPQPAEAKPAERLKDYFGEGNSYAKTEYDPIDEIAALAIIAAVPKHERTELPALAPDRNETVKPAENIPETIMKAANPVQVGESVNEPAQADILQDVSLASPVKLSPVHAQPPSHGDTIAGAAEQAPAKPAEAPAESSPVKPVVPVAMVIDTPAATVNPGPASRTIPPLSTAWQEDFGATAAMEADDDWRTSLPAARPADSGVDTQAAGSNIQAQTAGDDDEGLVIAFNADAAGIRKRPARRVRTAAA